jgi:hypothetical protein
MLEVWRQLWGTQTSRQRCASLTWPGGQPLLLLDFLRDLSNRLYLRLPAHHIGEIQRRAGYIKTVFSIQSTWYTAKFHFLKNFKLMVIYLRWPEHGLHVIPRKLPRFARIPEIIVNTPQFIIIFLRKKISNWNRRNCIGQMIWLQPIRSRRSGHTTNIAVVSRHCVFNCQ